jgi:hypothetical protein
VLPLAHPGHWIVDAAYFLPVVGFLAWLGVNELRSRRERRRHPDGAHDAGGA